jgi:hypothetical protein
MNRPRYFLSTMVGIFAALAALIWLCDLAHGEECYGPHCGCTQNCNSDQNLCGGRFCPDSPVLAWRWNTYYETTYGHCGCCTNQPTYFIPRLRPIECYTACGHYGAEPACLKCRCQQENPVAECGPWPLDDCLETYVQPTQFQRLGEIPNDMLIGGPAISAAP